jgi:hypothetical protein
MGRETIPGYCIRSKEASAKSKKVGARIKIVQGGAKIVNLTTFFGCEPEKGSHSIEWRRKRTYIHT